MWREEGDYEESIMINDTYIGKLHNEIYFLI